ncbi:EFR1 family ferrodoxin [Spirochaeta isovalerica]|uniref:Ferredoxin/flavodoxin n=1 Tax=Spirochaeta isovalerica TaxID=150 RepID=A0A841RG54_9SPIO|nr:EFR1 family ferrodoxin [Spirochaeta isovalerica]MBB6482371.1 ferredoxin/flavodoxin [Spirochaeta isovalerica]
MKNLYLYFSGTGNTKYVIGKFAELYERGSYYSLHSIEHREIDFSRIIGEAENIVLAYPIHDSMLPFIVKEFLESHIEDFKGKNLTTICTQLLFSGDGGALPFYILKEAGVKHLHSIHINMPSNLTDVNIFFNKPLSETARSYVKADRKIALAVDTIRSGGICRDGRKWFSRFSGFILQRTWGKAMMVKLRNSVKISSDCILCQKCVQICPVENLEIRENRVGQQGRCTLCYRCVNECPVRAISIFMKSKPKIQYSRKDYN